MMETGSEFREVEVLEPLWQRHKFWPNMKKIVTEGLTYPLEEISEETRKEDLQHMIQRGNHKSAQMNTHYMIIIQKKSNMDGCCQYPNTVLPN